ncbi:MAG TPA: hypothetical protein VEA69_23135 [Tepidisphaeraceae bacterium]|nr:hypothetical protein [Tepidisphaeraceae bacterium]
MPKFPPAAENPLIVSAANFGAKITAAPLLAGLTPLQATAFDTALSDFTVAHTVANNPLTRSPANVVQKNIKKQVLVDLYRQLAGVAQRFPGMNNFIRADLGIPLRNPEPSPIGIPGSAPGLSVKAITWRTVRIHLQDQVNTSRRGKPDGVSGAAVFSHVGATPPAELADWHFEGNAGRTTVDVTFGPETPSGATVWLTAYWFNPRKQAGPNATPLPATLGGGVVSAEAA